MFADRSISVENFLVFFLVYYWIFFTANFLRSETPPIFIFTAFGFSFYFFGGETVWCFIAICFYL